jgi:hypothetical protein
MVCSLGPGHVRCFIHKASLTERTIPCGRVANVGTKEILDTILVSSKESLGVFEESLVGVVPMPVVRPCCAFHYLI